MIPLRAAKTTAALRRADHRVVTVGGRDGEGASGASARMWDISILTAHRCGALSAAGAGCSRDIKYDIAGAALFPLRRFDKRVFLLSEPGCLPIGDAARPGSRRPRSAAGSRKTAGRARPAGVLFCDGAV